MKINKETIEYAYKLYPVVELFDFETMDGYHIDHAYFTSEDFMELCHHNIEYRMLDGSMYGYLPRDFIEKCDEESLRKYIKTHIG